MRIKRCDRNFEIWVLWCRLGFLVERLVWELNWTPFFSRINSTYFPFVPVIMNLEEYRKHGERQDSFEESCSIWRRCMSFFYGSMWWFILCTALQWVPLVHMKPWEWELNKDHLKFAFRIHLFWTWQSENFICYLFSYSHIFI